jgi:voltage-gated potassium channel
MSVVLILMIISSILMYNIEHDAQPETFQNAFSAMWWSVATLTTVGYGDIYPITIAGKIISAVIALLGIGLVAIPTGILSAGFVDELSSKRNKEA